MKEKSSHVDPKVSTSPCPNVETMGGTSRISSEVYLAQTASLPPSQTENFPWAKQDIFASHLGYLLNLWISGIPCPDFVHQGVLLLRLTCLKSHLKIHLGTISFVSETPNRPNRIGGTPAFCRPRDSFGGTSMGPPEEGTALATPFLKLVALGMSYV